jgi:hypothetical protein
MKPDGSLPCLQWPVTEPILSQFILYCHKNHFNIILPFMPLSPSDSRAGLDTVEKEKISSPYLELNPTHPAHSLSLHQLSYPTSFFLI